MRAKSNKLIGWYLKQRYKGIDHFMKHPFDIQDQWLQKLMGSAKNTEWGKKHNFSTIQSHQDFQNSFPVQNYADLQPYIERMMYGDKNVLWTGQTNWFSKSSGTTSGKSKFIPVSLENLKTCHIKGSWDTMAIIYNNLPNAQQFAKKSVIMGGSMSPFEENPNTFIGDISSMIIKYMPSIGKPFYAPDIETALIPDWEEKVEKMAQILSKEEEIVMIGGVPTWTIVLLERMLELTGAENMLDIWPNFQVYTHGGVSFDPYVNQFKSYFPSDDVNYVEVYNASEGFFGVQDDWEQNDMLLLLDNGIFYEFIPKSEWNKPNPMTIGLSDVEMDQEYALVISTNSGLWRYQITDTVIFTSIFPYRIKISGRVSQFINVFGEEVIVANTDMAIAKTSETLGAQVADYSVAPIFFGTDQKPRHQWLVEFKSQPKNLTEFSTLLDRNLRNLNSDYDAKRTKNMALQNLDIISLPEGTFLNWLRQKGKIGGQHKVPRLSNNRIIADEILKFSQQQPVLRSN